MRFLVCAVVLSWATSAVASDKSQDPAALAPTHGYVYVDFPKGGGEPITLRPVAKGRDITLDTTAPAVPLGNAQAFGQWLPAGRYAIAGWGTLEWKDGPQFDVEPGRVTDLGDYVIANVGGYQFVMVPIPHPEHAGGAALATRSFASVLKDPTPIPFRMAEVSPAITKDAPPSGRGLIVDMLMDHDRTVNKPSTVEALKSAKDPAAFLRVLRTITPPLQEEPARLADGTLYFPADFGQLRRRVPDGTWTSVGMDSLRQVLSVEAADGRLLAGTDDGHIRQTRDDGAHWTDVKALGGREAVIDIDHDVGDWVVTTTETFDDPDASLGGAWVAMPRGTPSVHLRVYVAHQDDLGDLHPSKEFTLAPEDQAGWLGARGQLVDGRYYIAAGTTLQRLDVASGQWTTITPGARVSSARVDPTTGVLTTLWAQGAFSKVFVSSDHGDHWTQIGRPPYIIHDVQMDALDRGWASRWNMGAFSGEWETYTFVPAKNDWVKSGGTPFNCRLMRVAADLPVLCVTADASIFGLHDAKWGVEFSAL